MATQTHDTSGEIPEQPKNPHPTPVASYVGIGLVVALVLAMIFLQTFGASNLEMAG